MDLLKRMSEVSDFPEIITETLESLAADSEKSGLTEGDAGTPG